MLKKPIPSTGGKNEAKSERIFWARVPGCTSRRHFRMVRCSLLCNDPTADPDIRNRASTLEIALQRYEVFENRVPMIQHEFQRTKNEFQGGKKQFQGAKITDFSY